MLLGAQATFVQVKYVRDTRRYATDTLKIKVSFLPLTSGGAVRLKAVTLEPGGIFGYRKGQSTLVVSV